MNSPLFHPVIPTEDALDLARIAQLLGGDRHYVVTLSTLEAAVLADELKSLDDPRFVEVRTGHDGRYLREREHVAAVRVDREALRRWIEARGLDLDGDNPCAQWLAQE